ncbi:MAG: Gfo/Idh/MocA family oxidoreductase [Bacillota bacterium]|nr:Gfo/Idh/MocA family oxidoreductase [Bacillota bacterium]
MPPRVLLAGPGSIAERVYLPLLASGGRVERELLWARRPERAEAAARRWGFRRWSAEPIDAALARRWREEGIVAAFVHVATEAHAAVAVPLLEAGLAVYLDKPLAYRLEEAERIVEAARRSGAPLVVGYNRRWAPLVEAARAAVPGPVWVLAEKHRAVPGPFSALHDLWDDFVHPLDLAVQLGADRLGWVQARCDDEGHLLRLVVGLEGEGPASAVVAMVRGAGADSERLELWGAGGRSARVEGLERLELALPGQPGWLRRESGAWESVARRRGFEGAIAHFLGRVAAWRQADDGRSALRTERLADEIRQRVGW